MRPSMNERELEWNQVKWGFYFFYFLFFYGVAEFRGPLSKKKKGPEIFAFFSFSFSFFIIWFLKLIM